MPRSVATEPTSQVRLGHTVPARWYTDASTYELEKQRIFLRSWQYVGLVTEISLPGDYLLRHAGHVPIIVVRDKASDIHAFVNVCRHRGSALIDMSRTYGSADDGRTLEAGEDATRFQSRGNRMNFQCPYHAWTYKLDGTLRSAPRADREPVFDKTEWSLFPVRVETWGPMMFVNPDCNAAPLSQAIDQLPRLFEDANFDLILKPREYREYLFRANWKITVDNFNECYHCPVAHPGLSAARDLVNNYKWFRKYHYSCDYAAEDKLSHGLHHGAFVWPNFGLSVHAGGQSAVLSWMLPLGLGQSIFLRQYCFADSVPDDEARVVMDTLDQVAREDKRLCENVQRGLEAGVFQEGCILAKSEMGVHLFQTLLECSMTQGL